MTLRHVVVFRFHPDTPTGDVDALASALRALPERIPEVGDYQVGPDLGIADTSWDFAVTGTFADADAFLAYRDHPDHQAVIAERVVPITAERVAVQFEV